MRARRIGGGSADEGSGGEDPGHEEREDQRDAEQHLGGACEPEGGDDSDTEAVVEIDQSPEDVLERGATTAAVVGDHTDEDRQEQHRSGGWRHRA